MMKIAIAIISVITFFLSVDTYAATPQENNLMVKQGLEKMQQGLKKYKSVPDNKTKTTKHSFAAVKAKIDNITKTIHSHKPANAFCSASKVKINEINVFPNSIRIKYQGEKIKYNIFRVDNIVALDIINPVNVCKRVKIYHPKKNGVISKVVVACHNEKYVYCDCSFIRYSIHTLEDSAYKITKKPDSLVITFSAISNKDNQTRDENTKSTELENRHHKISRKFIAKNVDISLKNISRIHSPYPVKQVIYSKEDRLQVQVFGNDIFVKVLPTKILLPSGSYSYIYSSDPRDIYIITEPKIYSLNLIPKKIPAVTYVLEPILPGNRGVLAGNINLNQQKYYKGGALNTDSYVNTILSLIKYAYKGFTPDDYMQIPLKYIKKYKQLTIKGEFKLVGQFTLYAYKVTANQNLNLDDSQFLWLIKKPIASDIVKPVLSKNESTMLFLVGGGNE